MIEVSVVMPCLDEAETVARCVSVARRTMSRLGVRGEVIVADNGSVDGSREIARAAGAEVVLAPVRGYGAAYRAGLARARGGLIVIGDSDGTYDFAELERFVRPLREGWDMVMGDRLGGEIEEGAMPWLNRRFGNPFLSGVLNLLFKTGVADAHCGMRSFTRSAWRRMRLRTRGMEFASEMLIEAVRLGLKIKEVPIKLHRAPAGRVPHLRPWQDGFRHLGLMLRRFWDKNRAGRPGGRESASPGPCRPRELRPGDEDRGGD